MIAKFLWPCWPNDWLHVAWEQTFIIKHKTWEIELFVPRYLWLVRVMFSVCTEYTHFWQVILSISTEGGGTCLHDLYLAPSLSTTTFQKQVLKNMTLCFVWCDVCIMRQWFTMHLLWDVIVHYTLMITMMCHRLLCVWCDGTLCVNDFSWSKCCSPPSSWESLTQMLSIKQLLLMRIRGEAQD